MSFMIWFLLSSFFISFLAGLFLSIYLTVHPLKMDRFLSLCLSMVFLNLLLIVLDLTPVFKLIIGVNLVFFGVIGYLIMTKIILSQDDTRELPDLLPIDQIPDSNHTAIVYFTHGEPETYNPVGWINQFKEFDEMKIKFIPFPFRPLFFYMLRRSYLKVGRSNHRQEHKRMLKSLEDLYPQKWGLKFYLCFLDDSPRPDTAVIRAINEGAKHVIVANVFLTISNHTLKGQELIQHLNLDGYDVKIEYTEPLHNSEHLISSFLSKVEENPDNPPKKDIGVILVGHGQPKEWDAEFGTETAQEISFREEIIGLFQTHGYLKENLKMAWMEFRSPKPQEVIDDLAIRDLKRIFYFSAAISADSIHSQYDVPHLIGLGKEQKSLEIYNLGAWNNHPLVIQAIKHRIEEKLHRTVNSK